MRRPPMPVLLFAALAGTVACSTEPVTPPPVIAIAQDPGLSGDNQVAEVGTQLPLGLRVLVTSNNLPAAGVDVAWAVSPGDGEISPVSTTNDQGIATGLWGMPTTSGVKSATASLAGANGSPVAFTAIAAPGPAETFEIQAGNNQSVPVSTEAGEPLIVKIEDQYGNGVDDVDVAWSVISGDATLSTTSNKTDLNGRASITVTAGTTPGPVVIRSIPNFPPGVSEDFTLTVTP